jgi:hypothetical protein
MATLAERWGDHIEELWSEEIIRASACEDGDCLYAKGECFVYPRGKVAARRCQDDCDHTCMGYEGFKHIESGRPLMRYRRCRRARAWDRGEATRLKQQQGTPAETGDGKGWVE